MCLRQIESGRQCRCAVPCRARGFRRSVRLYRTGEQHVGGHAAREWRPCCLLVVVVGEVNGTALTCRGRVVAAIATWPFLERLSSQSGGNRGSLSASSSVHSVITTIFFSASAVAGKVERAPSLLLLMIWSRLAGTLIIIIILIPFAHHHHHSSTNSSLSSVH
mgnify:CR=1 FL=1